MLGDAHVGVWCVVWQLWDADALRRDLTSGTRGQRDDNGVLTVTTMMAVAMGHQRAVLSMTLADAFLITGSRDFTIKVQAN